MSSFRHCADHLGAFKLNETLCDVPVCETACVPDTEPCYIKRSILHVECELARDTREALIDFSKLVVGAAEYKLFIGPIVYESKRKGYMDALAIAARGCSGSVGAAPGRVGRRCATHRSVQVYRRDVGGCVTRTTDIHPAFVFFFRLMASARSQPDPASAKRQKGLLILPKAHSL